MSSQVIVELTKEFKISLNRLSGCWEAVYRYSERTVTLQDIAFEKLQGQSIIVGHFPAISKAGFKQFGKGEIENPVQFADAPLTIGDFERSASLTRRVNACRCPLPRRSRLVGRGVEHLSRPCVSPGITMAIESICCSTCMVDLRVVFQALESLLVPFQLRFDALQDTQDVVKDVSRLDWFCHHTQGWLERSGQAPARTCSCLTLLRYLAIVYQVLPTQPRYNMGLRCTSLLVLSACAPLYGERCTADSCLN